MYAKKQNKNFFVMKLEGAKCKSLPHFEIVKKAKKKTLLLTLCLSQKFSINITLVTVTWKVGIFFPTIILMWKHWGPFLDSKFKKDWLKWNQKLWFCCLWKKRLNIYLDLMNHAVSKVRAWACFCLCTLLNSHADAHLHFVVPLPWIKNV